MESKVVALLPYSTAVVPNVGGTVPLSMGAIWWGTRGTCPPNFSDGGDITCYAPNFFLFRFWRGFKNKSDVCHVLCEEVFMLDGRSGSPASATATCE